MTLNLNVKIVSSQKKILSRMYINSAETRSCTKSHKSLLRFMLLYDVFTAKMQLSTLY